MLYLEKLRILLKHMNELKGLYENVRQKSDDIFDILGEIEKGINKIYTE
jgi:hypothetical protein